MVLLPNDWMLCWKERWKPFTSATMPISVPTPITIPSNASTERRRLAISASPAIRNVSRNNEKSMRLLVTERFDRIEARRSPGRIRAEEDTDDSGHDQTGEDRGNADRRGQGRDECDEEW